MAIERPAGAPAQGRTQTRAVVRQFGLEQGVRVEYQGRRTSHACEQRGKQALVVMRVDDVKRARLQQPSQFPGEQRIEQRQFRE